MATKIFVNVAVEDLARSTKFFSALGYTFNQQFTNDDGTCLVISDDIFAMLLVKPFFQSFLRNTELADATKVTEVLLALSCESRTAVDEIVGKALAAGATEPRERQDLGFMYSRAIQDLDGHIWEYFWMDPNVAGPEATAGE